MKQLGPTSYALRSIPEIGGGFVAEEVRTGRVLAMQGELEDLTIQLGAFDLDWPE